MSAVDPDLPPEPGEARRESAGDGRDLDVETAFAQIVAQWDAAGPPVGSWPAQEDLDPASAATEVAAEAPAEAPARPAAARPAARGPHEDPRAEEGWVPPELPPITRAGWRTWLPWVGVVGAPAFFLVVVLGHLQLPGLALLGGVVAFVVGFVTLVLRLPAHHDEDDGDGAVL